MAPKENIYSYPYAADQEVKSIYQNLDEDFEINFEEMNIESEVEDHPPPNQGSFMEQLEELSDEEVEDHPPNQASFMDQLEELSDEELDAEDLLIYQYLQQIENSSANLSGNLVFEGFFTIPNFIEFDSDESE